MESRVKLRSAVAVAVALAVIVVLGGPAEAATPNQVTLLTRQVVVYWGSTPCLPVWPPENGDLTFTVNRNQSSSGNVRGYICDFGDPMILIEVSEFGSWDPSLFLQATHKVVAILLWSDGTEVICPPFASLHNSSLSGFIQETSVMTTRWLRFAPSLNCFVVEGVLPLRLPLTVELVEGRRVD
jgi:hypothetical protein